MDGAHRRRLVVGEPTLDALDVVDRVDRHVDQPELHRIELARRPQLEVVGSASHDLVEGLPEGPADVGEDLGTGLDRVHVVAVELFRVVTVGTVVGVESLLRLGDHVCMFALEEIELPRDHLAEALPPEHGSLD